MESNKTFGPIFQYDLIYSSNLKSKFVAHSAKSSKYNFTPNVTVFSNILDTQQNQHSKNLTVLLSFFVVAVFSVLINLRVFHCVFITSNRRSRYAPFTKIYILYP